MFGGFNPAAMVQSLDVLTKAAAEFSEMLKTVQRVEEGLTRLEHDLAQLRQDLNRISSGGLIIHER